jgi:hypothetical protein
MPPAPDLAHDPHDPSEQPHRITFTLKSSRIVHNPQHEGVVHLVPCPTPSLQISGIFTEYPDEAGGVMMVENGALAQLKDFVSMESVFVADIIDAQAFKPCMLTAAWC